MTLGQRIRKARIERGLTQKQLVGDHITRNMLSKIENDSAIPSVKTLEFLAARLSCPVGYFLAGSQYSDGTSPDGLDKMRAAYRAEEYALCLRLLDESSVAATTDEGYLLRVRASLALAHQALQAGDIPAAKEYADMADYYNKQCIYYSAAVDAEMSLILAECALELDPAEFEYNAGEFTRAVEKIRFSHRFAMDKACYLLKTGEPELAARLLQDVPTLEGAQEAYRLYLLGACAAALGDHTAAVASFLQAEPLSADSPLLPAVYSGLEQSYKALSDFENAYLYAAKQLRGGQ